MPLLDVETGANVTISLMLVQTSRYPASSGLVNQHIERWLASIPRATSFGHSSVADSRSTTYSLSAYGSF